MPTTRRLIRSVHKWLGLLLAAQALAWLAGGLVMSVIPIEMVRGTSWVKADKPELAPRLGDFRIAPASLAAAGTQLRSAELALREGEPVYLLRDADDQVRVLSAVDGREIEPLAAAGAAERARAMHREHPAVASTVLVPEPTGEARGLTGPVWRVDLADRWHTRVYLDPATARLLTVRNDLWRIYDFFWMLHIMDYAERSDINNNLLRVSSGLAWFLGLSGAWLLFYSFGRRKPGLPLAPRPPKEPLTP